MLSDNTCLCGQPKPCPTCCSCDYPLDGKMWARTDNPDCPRHHPAPRFSQVADPVEWRRQLQRGRHAEWVRAKAEAEA